MKSTFSKLTLSCTLVLGACTSSHSPSNPAHSPVAPAPTLKIQSPTAEQPPIVPTTEEAPKDVKATVDSTDPRASKMRDDGVILTDRGDIASLHFDEAKYACPRGTHLPTAREWAKASEPYGTSILEIDTAGNPINGSLDGANFDRVDAVNPDGKLDNFIFILKPQRTPPPDRGIYWSSSLAQGAGDAITFSWHQTEFFDINTEENEMVKCFPNRKP